MTEEELNRLEALAKHSMKYDYKFTEVGSYHLLSLIRLARLGLAAEAKRLDTLVALVVSLRARLAEAEKVIKPFAEEAIRYAPDEGDGDDVLWDKTGWLRIKHLRAAAQWMKENKP